MDGGLDARFDFESNLDPSARRSFGFECLVEIVYLNCDFRKYHLIGCLMGGMEVLPNTQYHH